jgi:hypothetical protein
VLYCDCLCKQSSSIPHVILWTLGSFPKIVTEMRVHLKWDVRQRIWQGCHNVCIHYINKVNLIKSISSEYPGFTIYWETKRQVNWPRMGPTKFQLTKLPAFSLLSHSGRTVKCVRTEKMCVHNVYHCLALASKRYRTLGYMFFKPKGLENVWVNSLISLLANIPGLCIVP